MIELQMKKPRAKERIEVVTDEDYDDLLYWSFIAVKNNKVNKKHMIIRKDLANWTTYHLHQGWSVVETSSK